VLHGSNVEALSKHSGRVSGSKGLEIEPPGIEASTVCDGLTTIEYVLLPISGGRRKYELAVQPPGVLLKCGDEFCGRWDLALLAAA
jgi:hypothetical protein